MGRLMLTVIVIYLVQARLTGKPDHAKPVPAGSQIAAAR
jgi:hypothetical protein